MNESLEEVLPDILRAARSVAFKWPQVTTEDDMAQTLVLHFMERPGALNTLVSLNDENRGKRLTTIANQLASGERDDLGVFSGNFTYSVDEIKKLLAKGALDGNVEGFDAAVEDLVQSMTELASRNTRHWNAIHDRYQLEHRPDKDALSQGLEALTTLMNRLNASARYEYSNGGRFRNNRQATNAVDVDYNGVGRYDG